MQGLQKKIFNFADGAGNSGSAPMGSNADRRFLSREEIQKILSQLSLQSKENEGMESNGKKTE